MAVPEAPLRALKRRLEEAQQARAEHPDTSPGVTYCLECDEYVLATRTEDGEYNRLDCGFDHAEHHIQGNHDDGSLSAWISCIDYVLELQSSTVEEPVGESHE